eukprot:379540_1
MTLFGGDDDDDDIDIDCQNLQKQQIIKCIIQSRVIDTIIVIGDNYVQNVFSEQQGKNTNLVRNNLQHRSTPNTVNMKLFGVFNVPKQILLIEFHSHVMALSHIWKNVLRCHDVINVSNKNMIQQQMEMDRFAPKLPKVTCKSYSRRKRAIDKQNAIKEIWNKTTINVLSLARRALLKRGKSDNSDSS